MSFNKTFKLLWHNLAMCGITTFCAKAKIVVTYSDTKYNTYPTKIMHSDKVVKAFVYLCTSWTIYILKLTCLLTISATIWSNTRFTLRCVLRTFIDVILIFVFFLGWDWGCSNLKVSYSPKAVYHHFFFLGIQDKASRNLIIVFISCTFHLAIDPLTHLAVV